MKKRSSVFVVVALALSFLMTSVYMADDVDVGVLKEVDITNTKVGEYDPLILAGYDSTISRLSDGTWWAWGNNDTGQLGTGNTRKALHPTRTAQSLDKIKVKKSVMTDKTTVIQDSDGNVYTWGRVIQSLPNGNKPTVIGNYDGFAYAWKTSMVNNHSALALLDKGRVYVAGSGYYQTFGRGVSGYGAGELGTRSYTRDQKVAMNYPVLISGQLAVHPDNAAGDNFNYVVPGTEEFLEGVKLIEGNKFALSFLAVTNNNDIYSWGNGRNSWAVKNNNNTITGNIIKIAATENRNYALTDLGEVWYWDGLQGKTLKTSLKNIKDISAEYRTLTALDSSGSLFATGINDYGELLDADSTGFTKIKDNIITMQAGFRHTIWMDKDEVISGAGWNAYRQLASEKDGVKESFVKLNDIEGVDHIAALADGSFAVKGKDILAWGKQGGRTFNKNQNHPYKAHTLDEEVVSFKGVPDDHSRMFSITTKDGKTHVHGSNYQSRLGFTSGHESVISTHQHDPNARAYVPNVINGVTYVKDKDPTIKDDVKIIDAIQGYNGGTAIDEDGRLLAWGWSAMWGYKDRDKWIYPAGNRFEDKSTETYIRVPIPDDLKFKKVVGGYTTSVALAEDGTVWTRGNSLNGSIGRTGDTTVIGRMDTLSNIKDVAMSAYTGLALDDNGNIHAWGRGDQGQIGNGDTANRTTPANITNDLDVKFKSVHAGRLNSFAITEDGDLYAWGFNPFGQLGLGDRANRTSPRKVEGLPGRVKSVESGNEHTLVLLENGDVYVAGSDSEGQLGLGVVDNTIDETEVPFPNYVTIETRDNTVVKKDSVFNVSGNTTSIIANQDLELSYSIEGLSGNVEQGVFSKFKSTSGDQPFTLPINIDNKYSFGGYTLTIHISNKTTGLSNSSSINFALLDTTAPTAPKIDSPAGWTSLSHTIKITPGIDTESGVAQTDWRYSGKEWNTYTKPIVIDIDGDHTIEARTIDIAGNISSISKAKSQVDKTKPLIDIKYSEVDLTHNDVELTVTVSDSLSGIDYMSFDGVRQSGSTNKFIIKKNGQHRIDVVDKVGNKNFETITIKNIDKSLTFIKPKLKSEVNEISLDSDEYKIDLSDLVIKDWRDDFSPIKISVKADQFRNKDDYLLPYGTLWFLNKPLDTNQVNIDITKPNRGEYSLKMDPLKIKVSKHDMKIGSYKSTVTWDIIQAP